jgi:RNA polymerase sigma-70 factor, ECF subfamily
VESFSSDLELFEAIKAKNRLALEYLYDHHANLLYSLALQILQNAQDAEDLIQEIFVSLWNNCTYDPKRGTFKTFLIVWVRSRAIDRLRSRKSGLSALQRSGRDPQSHPQPTQPMDATLHQEIANRVQAALAALPDNQRQAIQMAYFEGLTQVEIATQFAVPVGTVKSWFRLGFGKLKQSLNDLIG